MLPALMHHLIPNMQSDFDMFLEKAVKPQKEKWAKHISVLTFTSVLKSL
jgi:hypothetical protein